MDDWGIASSARKMMKPPRKYPWWLLATTRTTMPTLLDHGTGVQIDNTSICHQKIH
jgi:hypothetical protein